MKLRQRFSIASLSPAIIAALLGASGFAAPAHADEFSIENIVFDGAERVGGSLTIFAADKVYDFLSEQSEAVVFDPARGRIVLVDGVRRVRSEISTHELAEFCARLQERAKTNGSDYVKFLAEPTFTERLDPETNELVLTSDYMEYRAKTASPKNADVLKRYQEFAHRQAQLNSMMNPGAPPPGARLKLNDALAARQLLPDQVTMQKKSPVPGLGKMLRAEHHYQWRIGEPDHRRIAQIDQQLGSFPAVSLNDYLRPIVESARK